MAIRLAGQDALERAATALGRREFNARIANDLWRDYVNESLSHYFENTNLPWLKSRTIFLTRHGSHAYGTNVATSDEDFKGVAIPPREYYLGVSKQFEQAENHTPDLVIYELRKFMRLASDCNPNVIEVLWTDESDHVLVTPLGQRLLDARAMFLSRAAKHRFSGYAIGQLKRMQSHHRWMVDPPKKKPEREDFNLPVNHALVSADQVQSAQAMIQKQLDKWSFKHLENISESDKILIKSSMEEALAEMSIGASEQYRAAGRMLGFSDNFLELLELERRYHAKLDEWHSYQRWIATRNPARSELESKFGYDTKHAGHLVRLLRMCREILTLGKVIVKRPDAEEIVAIRNGAWTYERVVEWGMREDAELTELAKTSPLPHSPDKDKIDALCVELIEESLALC